MGDKRTSEIPSLSEFENPFFDHDVQAILQTRKVLSKQAPPECSHLLKAWPIRAYSEISALANDSGRAEGNSCFYSFYNWDPDFISKLLVAITKYVIIPKESWDIYRIIVECQHTWSDSAAILRVRNGDIPEDGIVCDGTFDFADLAKQIGEEFPHAGTDARRENLRKVAHRVRINREKVIKLWKENYESLKLVVFPEDQSLMCCHPAAKYFSPSGFKIRRRKSSKM
jgi:hypothetical protein